MKIVYEIRAVGAYSGSFSVIGWNENKETAQKIAEDFVSRNSDIYCLPYVVAVKML